MRLNLRQARRLKDKTQNEMAELLNMHVQSYRKLEENPDLTTIGQAKKSLIFSAFRTMKFFLVSHSSLNRLQL